MKKTRRVRVYKKGGKPKYQKAGTTGSGIASVNTSWKDVNSFKPQMDMTSYKHDLPHTSQIYSDNLMKNVLENQNENINENRNITRLGMNINSWHPDFNIPSDTSYMYTNDVDGNLEADYFYNTSLEKANYNNKVASPNEKLNSMIRNHFLSEEKRGGQPCFECGGNVFQQGGPPPEQMMQQPGQEQMMQGPPPQQPQISPEELMQQIAQALQQGVSPEEIVQGLVEKIGVPQDQAVQMVTEVIETLKSEQQPVQEQQAMQQPPMEQAPPMNEGGNIFKEHPTDENNFDIRKDNIAKMLKSNVDDFEYDDMIKQADELMKMSYPQFKLGGEQWMQKAAKSMKKRGTVGSFKEYCGGKVSLDCIKKGLRSRNPKIRKKAGFAKASWKIAGKMQLGGINPSILEGVYQMQLPVGMDSEYIHNPDYINLDINNINLPSEANTIVKQNEKKQKPNVTWYREKPFIMEYDGGSIPKFQGTGKSEVNFIENAISFADKYEQDLKNVIEGNSFTNILDNISVGLGLGHTDAYKSYLRDLYDAQKNRQPDLQKQVQEHISAYGDKAKEDVQEYIDKHGFHTFNQRVYGVDGSSGAKKEGGSIPKAQGGTAWDVELDPQLYQTITPEDNVYGNINDEQLGIIAQYAKDKGVDVEDVDFNPQNVNIKKKLFKPNQMNINYSLGVKGQGLDDVKKQAQKDFGVMGQDLFEDWTDDDYIKYAEKAGLDYTPTQQGQMTAFRNKKQERENRKESGVGAFEKNFGREMDKLDIANAATFTTGALANWARNSEQNRSRQNQIYATIPGGGGNKFDIDYQGESGDRGDYTDMGKFRPDELGPDAYSMKNDASYFAAQKGGNVGDITYMTDAELKRFIEGGGQVEILDY